MRLRWLRIESFLCYDKAELDLPAGTAAIVGPNGAGKSSLFEAVSWALFGACRSKVEAIRADFASPEAPCRVELAFDLGGKTWRLTRELRGKALTPRARLILEGAAEPEAEGATAVNAALVDLLGMDARTFFASVFSRQKQVDALTEIPKGERQQAFRRMLGLHELDAAVKEIRDDLRDAAQQWKALTDLRKDPEALAARRAQCRDGVAEARKALARATAGYRAARAAAADARREFERCHGVEQQHHRLDKERQNARTKAEEIRKGVAQAQEELCDAERAGKMLELAQPKRDRLVAVRGRLKELEPQAKRHLQRGEEEKHHTRMTLDLKSEQESLAAAQAQRDKLAPAHERDAEAAAGLKTARAEAQATDHAAAEANARATSARAELKRVEERLAALRKLGKGGQCPTCLQELGESYADAVGHVGAERDAARAALEQATEAHARARGQAEAKQKTLAAAEEHHERAREAADRLKVKETECREKEKSAQKAQAALDRSRERLATFADLEFDPREHEKLKEEEEGLAPREKEWIGLERDVRRIPTLMQRIAEGTKDAGEWERQAEETEKAIGKVGFDPGELKRASGHREKTRQRSEECQSERGEAKAKWVGLQRDLAAVEKEIADERAREEQIAALAERQRELKVLESAFVDFRQALTDRIRPALAAKAGRLLERATSGRYSRVELDDDYEVLVHDAGRAWPLRRYSGGESDLINLCLRIAISKVIADRGEGRVNLLVLDEVFGSQDTQRKDGVLRALENLAGDFQQVFVITHDEFVKDRLESVLEVQRDPGGGSRVRMGGGG